MGFLQVAIISSIIGLSLACGGKLTGSKGVFTSPNYPNNYPNDANCEWTIVLDDEDKVIRLGFSDFELEGRYAGECADYVRIVDTTTGNELGKYCDNEKPGVLFSSGNTMKVEFKTDSSFNLKGFMASYLAIKKTEVPPSTTVAPPTTSPPLCGGTLTEQSGEFASPNYPNEYPNDAECMWNIEISGEEKVISLTFTDFELEERARECYDYVKITDTVSSTVIGQYCGEENPGTVYSSANKLRIEFKTDVSGTYRGFKANYKAINKTDIPPSTTSGPSTTVGSNCKTEVKSDLGFVISPNYPGNYPDQSDCWYVMRLATGGRISLEFTDFYLEHDNACANDYVTIHDGDNVNAKQIGKFCGSGTSRVIASGDVIFMRFVSDVQDNFRGFNATFQKAVCENLGGTCSKSCSHGAVKEWACAQGLQCCLPKLLPDRCGERPTDKAAVNIVGGEPAKPNSWPWQISLQTNGGFHYCGAVLFANQWVITAAHCVHDERVVNVVLGEHNRGVISGNEVRAQATKILIHPGFVNSSPWPNDVALLKLSTPLKPSPYYSPACMPNDENQPFMPNDTCYISGWGDTKGTGDSKVLNELLIKPNTNEVCRALWGQDSILDSHICIGNGEKGSCQGDSGGPLVCKKDKNWVLAGVTSWGIRGCRSYGYPSVYTRISKFLDWARKNMT